MNLRKIRLICDLTKVFAFGFFSLIIVYLEFIISKSLLICHWRLITKQIQWWFQECRHVWYTTMWRMIYEILIEYGPDVCSKWFRQLSTMIKSRHDECLSGVNSIWYLGYRFVNDCLISTEGDWMWLRSSSCMPVYS